MNELSNDTRFEFGKNWTAFLESVDERRIESSTDSLRSMLGVDRLDGKRFLDIGCGSGLSSLAAIRLGAIVHAFDYDNASVACSNELKRRFQKQASHWSIEQGSALDPEYLSSLGSFDVVYSWGVLHHTGNMKRAIELATERVDHGGMLLIAIYHDQGSASRRWAMIKRTYQRLPTILRPAWVAMVASIYETKFAVARLAKGQNPLPMADWKNKASDRGMSAWHDWVDWVGGWPFEVASPDTIINPLADKGFRLLRLKTVGSGWGCNEYVFRRESTADFAMGLRAHGTIHHERP